MTRRRASRLATITSTRRCANVSAKFTVVVALTQLSFSLSLSLSLSLLRVCAQTLTANVTLLDVPSVTSGYLGAFALHDADQDGQPGRWIGYPTEAVTATRGARGGPFGGPWWEDAVAIDASVAPCVSFEMAMWYP